LLGTHYLGKIEDLRSYKWCLRNQRAALTTPTSFIKAWPDLVKAKAKTESKPGKQAMFS
jgi:hypothetical protein